jgi:hypothetical protein
MEQRERPQWSALRSVVGDLRRTLDDAQEIQKRLVAVTGTV